MANSKRKEHAQEVELVPVYNKRLRKSFMRSRIVQKHSAQSHNALESKIQSTASSSDCLPSKPLHNNAKQTPPFTFNADGEPEGFRNFDTQQLPKKKRRGKVSENFRFPQPMFMSIHMLRLRMNSLRNGFP